MEVSKTKSSFYRRLYVAYLIDCQLASSVPELEKVTGMPRRTAQDTIPPWPIWTFSASSNNRTVPATLPGDTASSTGAPSTATGSPIT